MAMVLAFAPPLFVQSYAVPMNDASTPQKTVRRKIYEIIEFDHGESGLSKLFDTTIVTLIFLNILAFVAGTVPSVEAAYGAELHAFEVFSIVAFTIEYVARLWTAVEVPFLARLTPMRARTKFATTPIIIIDLLAILPFYFSLLVSVDLRVLRALRLLRFLKLSRYSPAMHTLTRVLSNERRALTGAGLLLMAAVLFASTGMYYLEADAQPDKFGSVPDAAWWAMATLTTVGYGDVVPITAWGRIFGSIVMIAGLCILALPVAIISTGFAQEVGRRDFVVNWSLISRIPMLSKLDAGEITRILPLLHAHNFPPLYEIIEPGDSSDAMYFLASGKVLMKGKNLERDFPTGSVFGAGAMLKNEIHASKFITQSKCRILKLYKSDFSRFEASNPSIAKHIREIAQSE